VVIRISDISSRDDRDWHIRAISFSAWIFFMRECTDALVQGEIAQVHRGSSFCNLEQASIAGVDIDERTAIDK
jgi:hypothetical protein